jgi:predicted DNA-binding transcriptional regulator AlpA
MTRRYLSRTEVAERIGVKPDTLVRYLLPAPDALIGTTRGWLLSTIDAWQASRPGRGVGGGRPRKG